MIIAVSNKKMFEQYAECLGFLVEQDFSFSPELQKIADAYFPALQDVMKKRDFSGKAKSILTIPAQKEGKVFYLIFAGFGKKNNNNQHDLEQYRRAVARLIRTAESHRCAAVALELPSAPLFNIDTAELAKETSIAAALTAYYFDTYITDADRKVRHVGEIQLIGQDQDAIQKGIDKGSVIAESVNMARLWIDMPPSDLTPIDLADKAVEIAKKNGLKCTVFNEKEIIHMGMGGLAGVSSGSHQDARFVILEYKAPQENAQTLALVGKGITFDSGGLSIKPAASMETMKDDMSGAAAVIVTMRALAQLKPSINVIAFAPMSENLPSGTATMPGDILRFYNGKTAEVKNTDAEGRLILADALSYAVKNYKLDAIIDIATLTGACSYALGPFFTGLMSQHDELAAKVEQAAERTGDRVWRLPLHDDFKPAVISAVADLCNIGSPKYRAGAITAGFFLQSFVEEVPWVHLDIAGTAFDVPDVPYFRSEGATGAGVRLLIDLAMHWK